jgi:hypothetical protein
MAKKIMIAAGLLGLGVVLALLFVLSRSNPSPTFAEQSNAVSYGLDYARGFGLVGDPAEITIAKMSYVEYRELIGEEVLDYHRKHNMEVWVLSMQGNVLLSMPGAPPTECDNIFIVLNAQTGDLKAVGARNQALQVRGGEKVTLQDGARFPITAPDVSAPGRPDLLQRLLHSMNRYGFQ